MYPFRAVLTEFRVVLFAKGETGCCRRQNADSGVRRIRSPGEALREHRGPAVSCGKRLQLFVERFSHRHLALIRRYLLIRNALRAQRGMPLQAHEKDFVKRYLAQIELERIGQHDGTRLAIRNAERRLQVARASLDAQRAKGDGQAVNTIVDLYLQAARVKPRFDAWMKRLGEHFDAGSGANDSTKSAACVAAFPSPRLKPLERIIERVVVASAEPVGEAPSAVLELLQEQAAQVSAKDPKQQERIQQELKNLKMRSIEAHSLAYSSAVAGIRDVVRGRIVMRDMRGIAKVLARLRALNAANVDADADADAADADAIEIVSVEDRFQQTGDRRHAIGGGWRDVNVYFRFPRSGSNAETTNNDDADHVFELQASLSARFTRCVLPCLRSPLFP